MAPALRNLTTVADNPIHKSILLIDPATPKSGKISFERFRLPGRSPSQTAAFTSEAGQNLQNRCKTAARHPTDRGFALGGRTYRFFWTSQSATSPSSTSSQPLNMAEMWLVRVWPVVVM